MLFYVYRLQAGEGPDDWIDHTLWCECPDGLREPVDRNRALELINWDRIAGDRYCLRRACPDDMT